MPEKLEAWAENIWREAVEHKRKWLRERNEAFKAYHDEEKPDKTKTGVWINLNKIRPKVDKKVGRLCLARPMPVIRPRGPEDVNIARVMQELHQWKADREGVWDQFMECKRRMIICGLGVAKEYFDPDRDDGLGEFSPIPKGDIVCEWVDEREIFIDPRATPPHYDNARYIIHAQKKPISELERKYPQLKGQLRSEDFDYGEGPESSTTQVNQGDGWKGEEGESSVSPREGYAILKEIWYKRRVPVQKVFRGDEPVDIAPEDIPEEERDQYEIIEMEEEQIWTMTVVQGHIVEGPMPSPYRHGFYPFVFFVGIPRDDTPYPYGEVHWLRPLNHQYNVIHSIIVAQAVKTQNPTLIVAGPLMSPEEEKKVGEIGTRPLIIRAGTGAQIQWIAPPPLSSALVTIAQILQFAMDDVASMPEVRKGKAPWAGISGKAIAQLASESAMAEVLLERHIEAAYTRWIQMRVSNIQQFMTLETAIRITQPETGEEKWIPINKVVPPNYEPQPGETVTERIGPNGEVERVLNDITIPKFDLKYVVDTSKEQSKAERKELAIEMFRAGAIDSEALLEELEYPNWQLVAQRVQQKNQALQIGQAVLQNPELNQLVTTLIQNPQLIQVIVEALVGGGNAPVGGETQGT